jgi:CheY-like chemotaxis protein
VTPHGSTRILQSEGSDSDPRLRVFVAEGSASDLFWLEMVFKGSRLPYILEIATNGQAAKEYLEQHADKGRPDLMLLDAVELLEQFPATARDPIFVLTNTGMSIQQEMLRHRFVPKPFTHEKLFECLDSAELNTWAERLSAHSARS